VDGVFGVLSIVGPFLAVMAVLVFVHEFGHYFIARYNGIRVEIFSLGFGPELFGWSDSTGTRWRVSAIPLGGYVKLFGGADGASTPGASLEGMSAAERAVAFHHKSLGQRAAVAVAGPASNFLFGILVIAVLLCIVGPPANQDGGASAAGFYNPINILANALTVTWQLTASTASGIWEMIVGARSAQELLGPIRAAELSGGVAHVGLLPIILLAAMFSVNFGVVNLLPIPILDGGHLVFYALEAIRGKPLSHAAQKFSGRLGIAIVLSIMVFAVWNDLSHIGAVTFLRDLVT
jgi:membrane-associated protease RseP (regulator of RpoE activity)